MPVLTDMLGYSEFYRREKSCLLEGVAAGLDE